MVQLREGLGLTTIVDHGDGTATVHGHLQFEVRVHGTPTDRRGWR
jgi:murein DD-endopeptidase MepM/ murein hydrolase activator NlpD